MTASGRTAAMIYPATEHAATHREASDHGHPAHRGFARAVDAEDVPMTMPPMPGAFRGTVVAVAALAAGSLLVGLSRRGGERCRGVPAAV